MIDIEDRQPEGRPGLTRKREREPIAVLAPVGYSVLSAQTEEEVSTPAELVAEARAATTEIRYLEKKEQLGVKGERAHERHSDTLFHCSTELIRLGHRALVDAIIEEDDILQNIEAGKELGVESEELKTRLSAVRKTLRSAPSA